MEREEGRGVGNGLDRGSDVGNGLDRRCVGVVDQMLDNYHTGINKDYPTHNYLDNHENDVQLTKRY